MAQHRQGCSAKLESVDSESRVMQVAAAAGVMTPAVVLSESRMTPAGVGAFTCCRMALLPLIANPMTSAAGSCALVC